MEMEEFCGSQFWNTNLTWNTETSKSAPDLTLCFQNTVLVWVPCVFLWVFSIFNYAWCITSLSDYDPDSEIKAIDIDGNSPRKKISRSSSKKKVARSLSMRRQSPERGIIPWSAFNISKIVICVVLIINQLIRLGITLDFKLSDYVLYPVDTYTPYLRACTYTLALAALIISKKKGSRSSIIQFIFWLLLVVSELFRFRTTLLTVFGNSNSKNSFAIDSITLAIVLELIDYPLIVGQFLLHCWADSWVNQSSKNSPKLQCPEHASSPLNRLFFSWFDSLAWKGQKKSLETKDLWNLNPEDKSTNISALFDDKWNSKINKVKSSRSNPDARVKVGALAVIFSAFGGTFLAGCLLKLIPDLLALASPMILNVLLAFITSDEDNWKGYFYATLLFLAAFISALISGQYNHAMYLTGMRIKSALVNALYKKSLVISNSAKKESTTGEIVNLMSADVNSILAVIPYINFLWSAPFQIGLALYFLWGILGPSAMAGVGVMLILIPANFFLGKYIGTYYRQQMKSKDERMKLISEILSGIKILKLYAWEPSFQTEVMKIRQKEVDTLRKTAYINAVYDFIWLGSEFMVAVVTFATYVLVDEKNVLDAQKSFVSLSLMTVMTYPLAALPRVVVWTIQANVSLGRINKFLNAEEIDTEAISHSSDEVNPVVIENGWFSWGKNENDEDVDSEETKLTTKREKDALKNINMSVEEGSLVAIVGPVGSGKSSLLSAILGELEKTSGRVNTRGSISYVAQQAWIQNGTLRDNILFGKDFDPRKYSKVIEACSLGPDLEIFPGRDKIEIGEKGINLSGGQKQRVSIARAVYNNSDLYLLDDPLSAVDSHVGKHIFEKVLSSKGLLKGKTRLIVTNALHFLHEVDNIVVMKNGEISQMGTYEELMSQKGEFAELINQYMNEQKDEDKSETESETFETMEALQKLSITTSFQKENVDKLESSAEVLVKSESRKGSKGEEQNQEELKKLVSEETMETKGVKWSVYIDYIRAAGWGSAFLSVLGYVFFQGFVIASSFWLSVWSNEPIVNGTQENREYYLGVYAGLGFVQSCSFVVATVVICFSAIRSASTFHLNMLARIMRAPMSFFDTTPTGRIVNRFSKDVNVLDNTLSLYIRIYLNKITSVVGTLGVIIYTTPIFIVAIIPISIFYYFVQKFYVPTSRQLKRLESVTISPIYSHFSETINGASTIRAYGEQQRFISESEVKVDENLECYYPSIVSQRWLAVRLETTGSLIIFFAALFTVFGRDTLNAGLVGVTISFALQITMELSNLVRAACELETNIVAVERLKEYGEIEQEAPWKSNLKQPQKTWPANGSIKFNNYQARYREGMDLVLRNITCSIDPAEKIGVVGRTGAGKSSLTLALFRIIEGVDGGSITVDGEDIRKLGLHDVRSRLTIIPQDPILFSGTLRFNLDPFTKYSDNAIWRALELSNLKTFVEGMKGELEFKVFEGGDNMSVGQKQLVCLARALLRKSKILVLDEATAAVDVETDDLIQKTIQSEFKDSTVITVAHRLNTIMDSTRVMVIDNGTVAEFDFPEKLLKDPKSQFYAMAEDAGLISNSKAETLNT